MYFVPMDGDEAIAFHDVCCNSECSNRNHQEFSKLLEDHSDHESGRTKNHRSVYRECFDAEVLSCKINTVTIRCC